MNEEIIYNISEISDISNLIRKKVESRVICFYGDMGSGKTTLIRAFCNTLGVKNFSGSPTYSLINIYSSDQNDEKIYHLDLYRLTNSEQALDIGFDELINESNAWVLIEWPQKIENFINFAHTRIKLEVLDDEYRKMVIENTKVIY